MKPIYYILIFVVIALALGLGLGLGLEKKKDEGGNTEKAAPNLLSGTDIFNLKQTEGFGTSTAALTNEFGYLPRFNSNPVYADNKWVAIGFVYDATPDNTFLIYYSDDGSNWQKANNVGTCVAVFGDLNLLIVNNNLAYGGGSWVAVGFGAGTSTSTSSNIYYSDNAVSWYPAYHDGQVPFGSGYGSLGLTVAYNGSSWVAVGTGEGTSSNIYYSDNAVSWYPAYHDGQVPFGSGDGSLGIGLAYNGSSWVAVGNGTSSNIYYSDNAVSWYPAYHDGQVPFGSDDGRFGLGLAYNGSSWVAVGTGEGTSSTIYYSDNAVSWYPAYHDGQVPFGGTSIEGVFLIGAGSNVVYNGSSWIALGVGKGTSASIYYSDNAVSWYPVFIEDDKLNFPDIRSMNGICFANGKVVIGAGVMSAQ